MTTRQVSKSEWRPYFDHVSKHLKASKVDILVLGLDMGAQVEAEQSLLRGLTYDSNDDAIDIFTEHLDHRIPSPAAVYVEEVGGALRSVSVVDGTGKKQVIELSSVLALPTE